MTQWWSWALTVVGVFGLWLAGRRSPWGWAVGIGAQVLWLAYAIATRQWGFLVSCFAYGAVYVKNFRSWRRAPVQARCDCDYFEGAWGEDENGPGVYDDLCECGHTRDQHKDRADACAQPADPQPVTTGSRP